MADLEEPFLFGSPEDTAVGRRGSAPLHHREGPDPEEGGAFDRSGGGGSHPFEPNVPVTTTYGFMPEAYVGSPSSQEPHRSALLSETTVSQVGPLPITARPLPRLGEALADGSMGAASSLRWLSRTQEAGSLSTALATSLTDGELRYRHSASLSRTSRQASLDCEPPWPASRAYAAQASGGLPPQRAPSRAPSRSIPWLDMPPSPSGAPPSVQAAQAHERRKQAASRAPGGGAESGDWGARFLRSIIFGLINALVQLPDMVSYTVIIFRDGRYRPYMGQLAKLVCLAGAMHQLCFAALSTLPFAVGQVQDIGIIFLSVMTSNTVKLVVDDNICGVSEEDAMPVAVATALVVCSVATMIVGLCVVIVGWLKVARLVQYVPLQVVGGYLAYVGYFCLAAGLALATSNPDISDPTTLPQLLNEDALMHVVPAVLASIVLMWILHRFQHPLVLPCALVAIPALFFTVLFASGKDMGWAMEHGWLPNPQKSDMRFWHVWRLYNLSPFSLDRIPHAICWKVLPRQVGTMVALFMVVSFGSSMDVAAIQSSVPKELNYNQELVTVGVSNALVGLLGAGFTGSYIFSTTLFSMRGGVSSRVHGLLIAAVELVVFLLPMPIIQYFPSAFLGALMIMFGVEILREWLWDTMHKVTRLEYGVMLTTFVIIMVLTTLMPVSGLELGILVGGGVALVAFAVQYASVTATTFAVVPSKSYGHHTLAQRAALDLLANHMTAVSLKGYIFFGSSVAISDRVKEVAAALVHGREEEERSGRGARRSKEGMRAKNALPRALSGNVAASAYLAAQPAAHVTEVLAAAPAFLILDFRLVNGIDATAARSFATLSRTLSRLGVELILSHLPRTTHSQVLNMLEAHGVVDDPTDGRNDAVSVFAHFDQAVNYCEGRLLAVAQQHGLCKPLQDSLTLVDVLEATLGAELRQAWLEANAAEMEQLFQERHLAPGERLFGRGDVSNELFFIKSGSIIELLGGLPLRGALPDDVDVQPDRARRVELQPGMIVGELDFFLERKRSCEARCSSHCPCVLYCLTAAKYSEMQSTAPQLANMLLSIVLRRSLLSACHSSEVIEHLSALS